MLDLYAVKWVKQLQREKNRGNMGQGCWGSWSVGKRSVGLLQCVSNVDERKKNFERYSTLMCSQKTSKRLEAFLD